MRGNLKTNVFGEGFCYTSSQNAERVARYCLHFSLKILEKSLLFKNIDKLLAISKRRQQISFSKDPKKQNEDSRLARKIDRLMEHYIDNVRIVAAYENYLKARLLLDGFIVHKIKNKHGIERDIKALMNRQRERPLKSSELPEIEIVKSRNNSDGDVYENLSDKTLEISIMIKPGYIEALKLPQKVVDLLQNCIKERNKLHYLVVYMYRVGYQDFKNYQFLYNHLVHEVNALLNSTKKFPQ